MKRFLKWFVNDVTYKLVDEINNYAKTENLTIVTVDFNNSQYSAIVLFERR